MRFHTKAAAPLALNLAALGLAAALAAPVHATEYIAHGGANCLPQHEEYNIKRNANGSMTNHSSAVDQTWECPIERRGGVVPLTYVSVRVFDQGPHSASPFVCSLKSIRPNGTSVQTINRTSGGRGIQELQFNSLDVYGASNISLRCRVPRKGASPSGIKSYHVGYD